MRAIFIAGNDVKFVFKEKTTLFDDIDLFTINPILPMKKLFYNIAMVSNFLKKKYLMLIPQLNQKMNQTISKK